MFANRQSLRALPVCFFTGRGRRGKWQLADACFLRKRPREPSQSSLHDARFPLLSLRDIFPRPGEVFPLRGSFICADRQMAKSSPLGGAGRDQRERTERVQPHPAPHPAGKSFSMPANFAFDSETFPSCQGLSLWESWQSRQALTERARTVVLRPCFLLYMYKSDRTAHTKHCTAGAAEFSTGRKACGLCILHRKCAL